MKNTMNKFQYLKVGWISTFVLCSVLLGQSPRQQVPTVEEGEWEFIYDWLSRPKRSDRPPAGFVPDAKTACAIAEAVARALYGNDSATRERPFRARLRNGVWTVMGTMNPRGAYGGVAVIQIRKEDGRVLFAIHTS